MAKGAIINTFGKDLEKYRKDIVKSVKDEIAFTASKLEVLATKGSPNFIHIDKRFYNKGLGVEVGVMGDNPMAAYIEFGTGLSAKDILSNYPQEIKDIAMKFYVNGEGTLKGKPYLYNNYLALAPGYEKRLKEILDKQRKV
ncbi:MAG: hypothetical protein ACI35Z_08485 [Sphingobacterium hotanense]